MLSSITKPRHSPTSNADIAPSMAATNLTNHVNAVRQPSHSVSLNLEAQAVSTADQDVQTLNDHPHGQHHATPIPLWQRELAASRVGRHSRASSIISTRTRLTHQSDDAQSVEFEAGGQSFRISRDGSRVTNTTAPPPYPGPPLDELTEASDEEETSDPTRKSDETVRDEIFEFSSNANSSGNSLPLRTHQPEGTISNSCSSGTRRSGPFELPQRLRSVLRWYGAGPLIVESQSSSSVPSKLRRTRSDSSGLANAQYPRSSASIQDVTTASSSPFLDAERQMQEVPWHEVLNSLKADDEQTTEISRYYNRIMRDMDREHRRRLHARDEELARLRELLNEKDIVYRQQLRERDHTIEGFNDKLSHRDLMVNDLKTRVYEMEESFDRRLEKAKNEVEDVWEKRWKEYEDLLMENMSELRKYLYKRRSRQNSLKTMRSAEAAAKVRDESGLADEGQPSVPPKQPGPTSSNPPLPVIAKECNLKSQPSPGSNVRSKPPDPNSSKRALDGYDDQYDYTYDL